MREVEQLRETTAELIEVVVSDEDMVDVVGDVAAIHRRLGEWLRDQRSELGGGMKGERWMSVERRSATRSYNTNSLLARFADALPGGQSPAGALQRLLERDVVRLQWRWTDLQKAAEQDDVTLRVANHEITDGDPDADVGAVWSGRVTLESVEAGEVIQ